MDVQDHAIYHVWIHLIFLPPMPEDKTICPWTVIEPRSSCFTSDRSNHYTKPPWAQTSTQNEALTPSETEIRTKAASPITAF